MPTPQHADAGHPDAHAWSVAAAFARASERFPSRVALCYREDGRWTELTYRQLSLRARAMAARLLGSGVHDGDRVAILSEPRPGWAVTFFGAIRAGAVVVPLDAKLGTEELAPLLADCAPRILAASAAHEATARTLAARLPGLTLVRIDEEPPGESPVAAAPPERAPDEVALIVYTSGTAGSPKGVLITFGNLLFQAEAFARVFIRGDDRFLSILPLNHLLELSAGLLGAMSAGATICCCSSPFPHEIVAAMRERRITAVIGVPALFAALKADLESELRRAPPLARAGHAAAMLLARALRGRAARRLLFRPLLARLGGEVRAFVCGGAPLRAEVERFFDLIGAPILQGYGLTEASPVVAVNTLAARRQGSVGRPLPGVEVRLADAAGDEGGEVLTRGPHVMKGYHRRPDLTAAAIDAEGWLHTGDRGVIDRDGFLTIIGRIKNLIVLDNGKKVHPEEVEAALSRSSAVAEVCVLGHPRRGGGDEVCAVAVPSETLRRQGASDDALAAAIGDDFARLATALAPYKRPSRVLIHHGELPRNAARKVRLPALRDWLSRQEER